VSVRMAAMAAWSMLAATVAGAQVGYPPARSPYLDLTYTQEVTAIAGYYFGRGDPAGVAPGSGAIVGAHYEWRVGGPAHLTGEIARIGSRRLVRDPAKPPATRDLGEEAWPLYSVDFGLAMSLTGARSWHRIVPEVKAGLGFISDFKGKADVGGFKHGTRFALTWGGGVRLLPGGNVQLRADLTNRLYSIAYPETYYQLTSTNVAPILTGEKKSIWRNNPAITIGFSYLFSR
jgi:hypothetical protein